MSIHVAILQRVYVDAILAGTKTVESRLTKTRRAPFDEIEPGERLFIKESGGPMRATALVGSVDQHEELSTHDVDRLKARYQPTVGGDDAYWASKRDARFAVFVDLQSVEPIEAGPIYSPAHMRAWYVLADDTNPLRDVRLSAGAIRNRYASLPGASQSLLSSRLTIVLPDGREIDSGFGSGHRLRWRGWGPVFDAHDVQPGDRMRWLAVGPRRYRVSFPDARQDAT